MNLTLTDDTRRFLTAIFPKGTLGQVWLANYGQWDGGPAATLALDASKANYYSPATMKAGATRRSNTSAERVYAVAADDVGGEIDPEKLMQELPPEAPDPIVVTTTRKGSKLLPGKTAGANKSLYDANGVAIRDNQHWTWPIDGGGDPAGFTDATHYHRTPQGLSARNSSETVLVSLGGGPVSEAMALEIAAAIRRASGKVASAPKKGGSKDEQMATEEQVAAVLRALPNRYPDHPDPWCADEPAWWRMCAAIKGALGERGLPYWLDWNEGVPQGPKYDPVDRWHQTAADYIGWKALKKLAEQHASPADYAIIVNATARDEFTDTGFEPDPGSTALPDEEPVVASTLAAFQWLDHKTLPVRPWLYGGRLVRGYVSGTIAAGGVGKSSLTLVEALAMVTGKDLLGVGADKMYPKPLRVYLWNGEDTFEEMRMRILAACKHHGIVEADIGKDRLFPDSGHDRPIKLVIPDGRGVKVNERLVLTMIETLKANRIDVLMIDPLVSAHQATENDNMQMDLVVKALVRIAKEANVAVEIVHHTRKGSGVGGEPSVDDARGASAVVNATRNTRVLTQMTKEVGKRHGIHDYKRYFCVHRDAVKTNLTPPLDSDAWYHMANVDLENGDPFHPDGPIRSEHVGVAEKWSLTAETADKPEVIKAVQEAIRSSGRAWKYDAQSPDWVGIVVGKALDIDVSNVGGRKMVKDVVDKWIGEDFLKKEERLDANRKKKNYIDVSRDPEAWDEP